MRWSRGALGRVPRRAPSQRSSSFIVSKITERIEPMSADSRKHCAEGRGGGDNSEIGRRETPEPRGDNLGARARGMGASTSSANSFNLYSSFI